MRLVVTQTARRGRRLTPRHAFAHIADAVEHQGVPFHDCLGRCLWTPEISKPPLAVCFGWEGDPDAWEDREAYSLVVPAGWRVRWEAFEDWAAWHPPPDEPRLLVVAPYIRVADVAASTEFRADGWKGNPVLSAATLLRAVRRAGPGQRIASVVPETAFAMSDREPREHLLKQSDLVLLAEGGPRGTVNSQSTASSDPRCSASNVAAMTPTHGPRVLSSCLRALTLTRSRRN